MSIERIFYGLIFIVVCLSYEYILYNQLGIGISND